MKKRWIILLLLLVLPVFAAAEELPFQIDEMHLYRGMSRSYSQGYVPTVSNGRLNIVLPILSEVIEGDLTAVITPHDLAVAPVKLQDFDRVISRKDYTFGDEEISAYLVSLALSMHQELMIGEYPFTITVSGVDAQGNQISQDFAMEAMITSGAKNPPPTLEIGNVNTSGDWLVAAESDMLSLTVTNLSPLRAAEGVVLEMVDALGDIFPEGSSVLRLGRIPAQGHCDVEIPLRVNAKAQSGMHPVSCTLTYSDSSEVSASLTESVMLDLRQSVRFAHSDPILPARVTHGDIPSFSITLMNMGKSVLSNMLLTFDIEGLSSGGSVLVGTIESGKSANGNANFKVDTEVVGDTSGTVLITYEDEYGTLYEETLPLKTTIAQKVALTTFANGTQGSTEEEPSLMQWIGWGTAALMLLLLIVQSVRLTRKIHKLEERDL
ncbi:MAG: hypothetical protein GX096_11140 [Clostridiales bacterium]|nr:hypothetical protein [Clostridiales bacterium]